MRIDIITIFPRIFEVVFSYGVIAKAIKKGLIDFNVYNLRDYSKDKHKKVDDKPYGGGSGMVLKAQPLISSIKKLKRTSKKKSWVIYVSPQGKVLNQKKVFELYKKKWLIIVCGRYEGIDERVMDYIDEEISIGDYVLTGGEIPAMVLVDAVCRYVDKVVKEKDSLNKESFISKFLDYPQWTRPSKVFGKNVPKILLSGNHLEIKKFRLKEAIRNTYKKRPDIISNLSLNKYEKELLKEVVEEENSK